VLTGALRQCSGRTGTFSPLRWGAACPTALRGHQRLHSGFAEPGTRCLTGRYVTVRRSFIAQFRVAWHDLRWSR
jgi:hypothetical protein